MSARPIRLVLHGAAGRMGRELVALSATSHQWELVGAITRSESQSLGQDVGELHGLPKAGVTLGADFVPGDVVIDFSLPSGVEKIVAACVDRRVPLLSGTTGLGQDHMEALEAASRSIPVLWAANTSLGVQVTAALLKQASAAIPDADIEIVDVHHREKIDAPSGTALFLGEAAASGRGQDLGSIRVDGRSGSDAARHKDEIGFAAVRGGSVAGEHRIMLLWEDERIEICHAATHRRVFARGALQAAAWLTSKQPGFYAMSNMLEDQP